MYMYMGVCLTWLYSKVIANEQPRKGTRLKGSSLIEPCTIVPGAEKILNQCR